MYSREPPLTELSPLFDLETVHSGADLIAGVNLGVACGERVEERAVAAAEVADADETVFVARDFEVTAREKLVGHAHVAFASNHESALWDLELLSGQRTFDADQHHARGSRGLRRAQGAALGRQFFVDRAAAVDRERLDWKAVLLGRIHADERRAGAKQMNAFADDRFADRLSVEKRAHVRVRIAQDEILAAHADGAVPYRQLRFRQLHVTTLASNPKRMLVDREHRVDRFLRSARDDAYGTRPRRSDHRLVVDFHLRLL